MNPPSISAEVTRSHQCLRSHSCGGTGNTAPLRYHLTALRGQRPPGAERGYLQDWVSGGTEVRGGQYGFGMGGGLVVVV